MGEEQESPKLPSEIRVEELLPEGVRYVLPRRPQPALRVIGPVLIVIGLGVVAGAPFGLGFGALFGIGMLAAGLYFTFGQSEVTLQNGVLTNLNRVGPFFRRKRVHTSEIPALTVEPHPNSNTNGDFFAVWAGSTPIAPGYPRIWCNALAQDLSRRCATPATAAEGPKPLPVQLAEADVDSDSAALVPREQPPDSKILINERPDGLTIAVPPAGMWSASGGLFVFAIIWCGFLTLMTTFAVIAAIKDPKGWFAILFLSLFWAVGGGLMAWAINMGRRRLDIAVAGGRLLVIKTSPFGVKRNEWDLNEIAKIEVGNSGMEVNDSPVLELQIRTQDGKKQGFLGGRDVDELEWLASVLAQRWRTIAQPVLSPDGTALPRNVALPADSPITKTDRPEGLTIEIPRAGLIRGSKGLIFMAVGWNVILTLITTIFVVCYLKGNGPGDGMWFACAFFGLFMLIGIALLLAAINMGVRRASIAVAGGRLLVIQTGLFGEKKKEWDADELKDICAGPSGMKVNNVDVLELQVHTLDGQKQGFLSGRRDDELYWLAATIQARLRGENGADQ